MTTPSPVQIGALVPLTRPGWVDAGRHLLAGLVSLGVDGAAIPFLRYLPERLTLLGAHFETTLRERLAEAPSFVAFEGYDTITVLAEALRFRGIDDRDPADPGRFRILRTVPAEKLSDENAMSFESGAGMYW